MNDDDNFNKFAKYLVIIWIVSSPLLMAALFLTAYLTNNNGLASFGTGVCHGLLCAVLASWFTGDFSQ